VNAADGEGWRHLMTSNAPMALWALAFAFYALAMSEKPSERVAH
jgi:hypothetical protein